MKTVGLPMVPDRHDSQSSAHPAIAPAPLLSSQLAEMRGQLAITCTRNSDMDLVRFLEAQKGDMQKAVKHYTAFAVWHRDYCSKLTVASPGVVKELRKGYLLFDETAADKLGRPVLVFVANAFNPKTVGDVRNLENMLSYVQERLAEVIVQRAAAAAATTHANSSIIRAASGVPSTSSEVVRTNKKNKCMSQYLCVCDLRGIGVRRFNSKIEKTALDLMNQMYPGMVSHTIAHNRER